MGPYGRTRSSTRTRKSTRKQGLKRNLLNDQQQQQRKKNNIIKNNIEVSSTTTSNSSTEDEFPKTEGLVFEAIDDDFDVENSDNITGCSNSNSNSGCSTPKGQRFRIPEISTCPPAPKKRRILTEDQSTLNCSVRRSPIAFFAPPDLELFFHYALRGISV